MPGVGGDQVIQITQEEHDALAIAKRVIFSLLATDGSIYTSPSVLVGSGGVNAMMVGLSDPTTGAPIEIKNPSLLASGSLTNAQSVVYTAGAKAWLTKIHARNAGGSTRTVTFAFRASATGTVLGLWPAIPLATGESFDLLAEEGTFGLSAGNQILAQQDAGTDVVFVISGEELT